MTPTIIEKSEDLVGIFELCNPHLLPEDILINQLTSKFPLHLPNMSRSQIVDLYSSHISPKEQRVHRENRRGILLKRLQRSPVKKNTLNDFNYQLNVRKDKRVSSGQCGPEPKRSKITWP
jgi:hypothetical protein